MRHRWEYDHLRRASAVLFWFPPETLCPIALYELGCWTHLSADRGVPLFIGCHKDYARKDDVRIQTELARPDLNVRFDFDEMLADVAAWYNNVTQPKSEA